jgi:hypothetical protein
MSEKEAQAALAMKGLGCGDADLVLTALTLAGSVHLVDSIITIPVLDQALQQERAVLANRMAGWVKRSAGAKSQSTTRCGSPRSEAQSV